MAFEETRHMDLKELGGIIARNRLVVLYAVVAACAAALLFLYVKTPVYRAGSVLAIEERKAFSGPMEGILGKTTESADPRDLLDKIRSRIKSRPFLLSVANDPVLNLDNRIPDIPSRARRIAGRTGMSASELRERLWVEFFRKRVGAEVAGRGLFFIFTQIDEDPELTYDVARVVARRFIESMRQGQLEAIRATADFSEEQRKIYKTRFDQSEHELRRFKESIGLSDEGLIDDGNMKEADETLKDLDQEVIRLRESNSRKSEDIRRNHGVSVSSMELDDRSARFFEELKNSQWRLVKARVSDTNMQGATQAAGSAANELLTALKEGTTGVPAEIRDSVADALLDRCLADALAGASASLKKELDGYRRSVSKRAESQSELKRLEDEVARNQGFLRMFEQQVATSGIAEAVEIQKGVGTMIEEIEPAVKPIRPLSPDPKKAFLLALIAGPLVGFGFVLMLEYMDTSIRKVEEIEENFGVTVLGTIPRLDEPKKKGFWRSHRTTMLTVIALIILASIIVWVIVHPPASLAT